MSKFKFEKKLNKLIYVFDDLAILKSRNYLRAFADVVWISKSIVGRKAERILRVTVIQIPSHKVLLLFDLTPLRVVEMKLEPVAHVIVRDGVHDAHIAEARPGYDAVAAVEAKQRVANQRRRLDVREVQPVGDRILNGDVVEARRVLEHGYGRARHVRIRPVEPRVVGLEACVLDVRVLHYGLRDVVEHAGEFGLFQVGCVLLENDATPIVHRGRVGLVEALA
jgi:hypothetical protein